MTDDSQELVRRFVDLAISACASVDVAAGVPLGMRTGEVDPEGWVEWRTLPSTVTEGELDSIEAELRVPIPKPYRRLLRDRYFVRLRLGVEIEGHVPGRWRENFLRLCTDWTGAAWSPDVSNGLLPFGLAGGDTGRACFDTRKWDARSSDCPVICHDFESAGTEHEFRPLFSSCSAMFRCLIWLGEHGYQPDAIPTEATRETTCARFRAIDPEGAGGPGWNSYWSSMLPEHLGWNEALRNRNLARGRR